MSIATLEQSAASERQMEGAAADTREPFEDKSGTADPNQSPASTTPARWTWRPPRRLPQESDGTGTRSQAGPSPTWAPLDRGERAPETPEEKTVPAPKIDCTSAWIG